MSTPVRSYGGKSALERSQERRTRLVEATIAVLAAHGETGTTMTAICARAGLTERYFYESFPHRDDALLAALDHVCERIARTTRVAIEATPGSPEERVHAVMAAFFELVSDDPTLGLVAVVHSSATPRLRARRHYGAGFAELVGAWLTGEVDLTPDQLTATASDLFHSLSRRP